MMVVVTLMLMPMMLNGVTDVVQQTLVHAVHIINDIHIFHFVVNQSTVSLALPLPSYTARPYNINVELMS